MDTDAPTRGALRRQIRRARHALSPRTRFEASHALCQNIVRSGVLLRYRRFAAFYPNDAEVNLSALFPRLWQQARQLYLPVIARQKLWFLEYRPETPLRLNRFGIPEPRANPARRLPLMALDVVFMPLVAFDDHGHRLGMGGGYYDRSFARHRHRAAAGRPLLVGVGYELQNLPALPAAPWDVPLDAAITERKVRWFSAPPAATTPTRSAQDSGLRPGSRADGEHTGSER